MLLFSGSSNPTLAAEIAKSADIELGKCLIQNFTNGEKRVRIESDVHDQDVVIVQSFSAPVDTHIIELLLMVDALERAGAQNVSAIIPWMGYSLQDKVFMEGEPIAARVVADVVSQSYIQRVMLLDLHNAGIAGFFSVPTVHVRALDLFAQSITQRFEIEQCVAVSPDFGAIKQARVFADKLQLKLANVDKHRDLITGEVRPVGVTGEIEGKICLVYDDVVNTGGTVLQVAQFLKQNGAREVHFVVSHGLFAGEGLQKMQDQSIDSVMITNSVYHSSLSDKIKVLSVASLFANKLRKH